MWFLDLEYNNKFVFRPDMDILSAEKQQVLVKTKLFQNEYLPTIYSRKDQNPLVSPTYKRLSKIYKTRIGNLIIVSNISY